MSDKVLQIMECCNRKVSKQDVRTFTILKENEDLKLIHTGSKCIRSNPMNRGILVWQKQHNTLSGFILRGLPLPTKK